MVDILIGERAGYARIHIDICIYYNVEAITCLEVITVG